VNRKGKRKEREREKDRKGILTDRVREKIEIE
jgi:hypothetical protein